jgi:hypothetical protein
MLRLRASRPLIPHSPRSTTLKKHSKTTEPPRRGDGRELVPVLAQLLDVSEQLSRVASPSKRAAAAAGFVSYRFDPPQRTDSAASGSTARLAKSPSRERSATTSPAEPHILGRSSDRSRRDDSPILPRSNPFAIPSVSLLDAMAPAIRFLLLFALFTAAGTWIMSNRRQAEPVRDISEPTTTAAQPALDLPILKPSEPIEPPAAGPTAAGPLGDKAPRTGWRDRQSKQLPKKNSHSAVGPTSAPPVTDANWQLVPQVQASDPPQPTATDDVSGPPALARIAGYILAAPAQQAEHDDEPSLH